MEEIGRTQITRVTAIAITTIFLAFIAIVMASDLMVLLQKDAKPAEITASKSNHSPLPNWLLSLFEKNRHVMSHIRQIESNLEEHSKFSHFARPIVQSTLAHFRESSGDVMIGKDGWLFYRPSLRFLTHPQSPSQKISNTQRGLNASAEVISQFSNELSKRGIRLVIVPVWPKMSVHPEHFGAYANKQGILKPDGYDTWLSEVESSGTLVFDPAPSILKASSTNAGIAYLKTDSHWNPTAMKTCAEDLAAYLIGKNLIQKGDLTPSFVPRTISNKGDLARMMDLPENNTYFPAEEAELIEVREESGNRWTPKKDSPILLLGDSFSNIFSLRGMGWGEDAGFSEHLGAALGMRIDTILRNSDGASATRGILSRELSKGKDRLEGKKIVVWEFAASQLTEGDWLPFSYDTIRPATNEASFLEVKDQQTVHIKATIAEIGDIPHPQSTVYADFVSYMILDDLVSDAANDTPHTKALAYGLVMKNRQATPLADLRPGQTISATLNAWTQAENEFGRLQRGEPDGDAAFQPMNWISDVELLHSGNDPQAR